MGERFEVFERTEEIGGLAAASIPLRTGEDEKNGVEERAGDVFGPDAFAACRE